MGGKDNPFNASSEIVSVRLDNRLVVKMMNNISAVSGGDVPVPPFDRGGMFVSELSQTEINDFRTALANAYSPVPKGKGKGKGKGAPGKPAMGAPGKPTMGAPGKPTMGAPGKPTMGAPGKPTVVAPGKP